MCARRIGQIHKDFHLDSRSKARMRAKKELKRGFESIRKGNEAPSSATEAAITSHKEDLA
jgi:hypothetical protein